MKYYGINKRFLLYIKGCTELQEDEGIQGTIQDTIQEVSNKFKSNNQKGLFNLNIFN